MAKAHLKVTKNSDKFRQPAIHFQKYETYTYAPPGTSEYIKYWTDEAEYCMKGFTAEDGEYIPGYYYYYLNYFPINLVTKDKNGKAVKKSDFPAFYDYDRFYFDAVEEAESNGLHMVVLKARRKGYSYKVAAMLSRNFYFFRGSKGFALAAEAEFLVRDGILNKAWDSMDFIDSNTAWYKKRQTTDTKMHKRASFKQRTDAGVDVELGYKSEIIGVTLKNDPQKARGKAGKLVIFEEAGKFRNLLQAWQIALPSVKQGSDVFGLMIAFGTGGTEGEDFESLKELFEKPKGYECLAFENIWDEDALGQQCGFFIPQYANLEGNYDNPGDPDHGLPFMDEDGNTNVRVAKRYILEERKKVIDNASDKRAIDRHVAEQPITPAEATLNLNANIFPKLELQKHLALIRNDEKLRNFKQVGDLYLDNEGLIKWEPELDRAKQRDIVKYRLDPSDNPAGQIVIWEHPVEDAPFGLYIGGCLTPGEKVNTKAGLKNVEDITLDDQLISKDGDFVNINTLLRYEKENEPTRRIKMSNIYRTTNYTQEHPLYLSETPYNANKTINEDKFNFDFIRARDVKEGMWTKYPNYYRKELPYKLPFELVDESSFWWFIGLWLGDGWTSKDNVYVCFNKSEQQYMDMFEAFTKDVMERKPYSRLRGNCVEYSFGHRELSKYLSDTFGNNALRKKLPEWVKFIPAAYKKNLIHGYLASDGCITRNKKYYSTEFVSISQELLEGFQDILFSLGIISNMNLMRDAKESTIQGRKVNQLPTWHLRLSHHSTIDLAELMSFTDDIKINRIDFENLPEVRKQPKDGCFFSRDLEYIYVQIKDIEDSVYTGTVYNFDCETHTFICQYLAGHNCDPYDHDKSGTNSLGSVFIYKRFQSFERYYDMPVAEYTGRPESASEFYEIVRILLMYYKATLLYENEKKGLFFHFDKMNSLHLLADQPDGILKDIVKDSKVQRGKGIHMNASIKDWGELAIRDWLNEEYEPGVKNLTKIFSEPLLEELISYNDTGNFDRVMSFMTVIAYKQELHKVHVKQKTTDSRSRLLFPDGGPFATSGPQFLSL